MYFRQGLCRGIGNVMAAMLLLNFFASYVKAEPQPGDLFREYMYTNAAGDAGGAIRVGGKHGVSYPDRGSDFNYVNAWIAFPHQLDLRSVPARLRCTMARWYMAWRSTGLGSSCSFSMRSNDNSGRFMAVGRTVSAPLLPSFGAMKFPFAARLTMSKAIDRFRELTEED